MIIKNNTHFIKAISKITGSNICVLFAATLLFPLISRLFPSESFGIAAIIFSFGAIGARLACFQYQTALPLPKKVEDASSLFLMCITSALVFTCISYIVIWQGRDQLATLFNISDQSLYFYYAPIYILFFGLIVAFESWSSRRNRFTIIGISRVLVTLTSFISKCLFGITGYISANFLIIGELVGAGISVIFYTIISLRHDTHLFRISWNVHTITENIKRYIRFPLIAQWGYALQSVSDFIPIWILALYFDAKIIGYYSFARIVLHVPIHMISESTSRVFLQFAANNKNETGKTNEITKATFVNLFTIGFVPFLLLFLSGEDLFSVIFGNQWKTAGIFAQILTVEAFSLFITRPLIRIYSIYEKHKTLLFLKMALLGTQIIALLCGGHSNDPHLALQLYAVTTCVVMFISVCFVIRITKTNPIQVLKAIIPSLVTGTPFIVITILAQYVLAWSPEKMTLICAMCVFTYLAMIEHKHKVMRAILAK